MSVEAPLIVAIEGNIGVGKSTVISHLKETFAQDDRVIVLPEPVDEWIDKGFLAHMYDNADDPWMLATFQHMVLMSLTGELLKALRRQPSVIIMERSPWSNFYIFGQANLREGSMSMDMYRHTWEKITHGLPPTKPRFIYLDTKVDTVVGRVRGRSREAETGTVSADYLVKLHENHRRFVDSHSASSITIDAEGDKDGVKRAVCVALQTLLREVDSCDDDIVTALEHGTV